MGVDDFDRKIQLLPPEQIAPLEDKAVEKLQKYWPEQSDELIVILALEGAVDRVRAS